MAWIMPVFVACSTFGSVNGGIFASSRLFFVGARSGHMPRAMALLNVHNQMPIPCLIFLGVISLAMLTTDSLYDLINYTSFVESLFQMVSVAGLLYLRWKKPDLPRPVKVTDNIFLTRLFLTNCILQVNLFFPLTFFLVCGFLVIFPIYTSPELVGVDLVILAIGVVVYLVFIRWTSKPKFIRQIMCKLLNLPYNLARTIIYLLFYRSMGFDHTKDLPCRTRRLI